MPTDITPPPVSPGKLLARDLLLYTAARLLLVAAITGAIIGVGHLAGVAVPQIGRAHV